MNKYGRNKECGAHPTVLVTQCSTVLEYPYARAEFDKADAQALGASVKLRCLSDETDRGIGDPRAHLCAAQSQ